MSIEITSYIDFSKIPRNKREDLGLEEWDYKVFFEVDSLPSEKFMLAKDCEKDRVWDETTALANLEPLQNELFQFAFDRLDAKGLAEFNHTQLEAKQTEIDDMKKRLGDLENTIVVLLNPE